MRVHGNYCQATWDKQKKAKKKLKEKEKAKKLAQQVNKLLNFVCLFTYHASLIDLSREKNKIILN